MISGRKRGFCPKPLKSPDPDHHNRSLIVCTKSPDVKAVPVVPKGEDFNILTREIAGLRQENQRLKEQLQEMGRRAERSEADRLRALSQEKQEELSNSRTRLEKTKQSTEQLRRQLQDMRHTNLEFSRLIEQKDDEIRALEERIRKVRAEEEGTRILEKKLRELEHENTRLRDSLGQNPTDSIVEQNFLLLKRVDELLGENESLKDLVQQFSTGETSRIRQLKQKEKQLRLELAKASKEGHTPKKETRLEQPTSQQAIDRLKQYFDKESQLCRNRLYEIREQLAQAESRLEESERTVRQLRARVKHQKHLSSASANPERAKNDYSPSPIARGDSGIIIDRMDDDDEPHVADFEAHGAGKSNIKMKDSLVKKLEQQEHFAQDLLKANRAKDVEFTNMSRSIKQKDAQISSLRNTNRVLQQRTGIIRNQLEEVQKQLQGKIQELQQLKKNTPPSRQREIEQLKRQLKELRSIIQGGRPHNSSAELEGLKKYVLSLNEALDSERRRTIKLEAENDELRNAASTNLSNIVANSNEQVNRARLEINEMRLRIEELYRENQLLKISAVKSSTSSTEIDKLSFMNTEISSLRETIQHLRKANFQLQDELRRCQTVKAEMSHKLNQLLVENQSVGITAGQLRERQTILERELDVKNSEIENLRTRLHESTRALTGSAAKANEQNNRLQDQLQLAKTENLGLRAQQGDFERLRKDYQLVRTAELRKGSQLEEALRELAQCRELLTSVNLEEIESKSKQTRLDNFHNRSKERVIKISIQKDGLKWEVERLKQHVVALADEVARLAHEREVLQAEVNRVTQDREIESRRTRELSEIIKKYIEAKWEDTGLAVPSIRPLEVEITRQLRQLEWPTDLSGLKVSLKRMQQNVERIRSHLQQFNNPDPNV